MMLLYVLLCCVDVYDRIGNMGATIYNIPAVMKELLAGLVRKIVRRNDNPQVVANIMYSFSEMQYSWEMIGEETREALLQLINDTSSNFTSQVIKNILFFSSPLCSKHYV